FHQRRRPDRLAGPPDAAGGFLPADPAGPFGADQAHRLSAGNDSGSHGEGRGSDRGGAARRGAAQGAGRSGRGEAMSAFLIENMAPLMFASLIVVMLIGYPV